jgi:uncharacterized caspase-like protein
MKITKRVLTGLLFCCAAASMTVGNAFAARHALVIGNDRYHHIPELKNARADAKAMADALKSAGFKVTLALDQKQGEMKRTIRNFKGQLSGGDEAVFFYSGHGVQIGGTNYLLPVDLGSDDEEQVKDEAIPLQRVLDDLQDQKARFALAIIDACRDNPFKSRGRNIGTRGLAPTSAADGQMIIFSAGNGQQALDRMSDNDRSPNGVFTRVFLEEMKKPGQPIHEALRNVRTEVVRLAKSVNHQQTPAIYDQAVGNFFFVPGNGSNKRAPEMLVETVKVVEPVPEVATAAQAAPPPARAPVEPTQSITPAQRPQVDIVPSF